MSANHPPRRQASASARRFVWPGNGFTGAGICKAFDLVSGVPSNTDSPWWSLPETMRAAVGVHGAASSDAVRTMADAILAACHGAFVSNFVRYDLPDGGGGGMAFQTIDGVTAAPLDVIPATADADPGYHTGLSIIHVITALDARAAASKL